MKKIMCFGDSNTWGHNPVDFSKLERPWPVVLGELLPDCEIISEGVCGRTTHMDLPDEEGKNGWDYFRKRLDAGGFADGVDLLIIMLGTNDVLKYFDCSAEESAEAIAEYIRAWRSNGGKDVLVVSPIYITERALEHPTFKELYTAKSPEKSRMFAGAYKAMAEREGAYFTDAARFAKASDIDGIHMTPEEHERLAGAVAGKVKEIFG